VQAFQSSGEVVKKAVDKTEKAAEKVSEKVSEKVGEVEASTGPNIEVQSLWPLGVIASGGALFAISKVDKGFANILNNVAVKVRDRLAASRSQCCRHSPAARQSAACT